MNDVIVLPSGALLAVGEAPGIYRSDDQGATWQSVPNPSTGTLEDVEVVTGVILSAVGAAGQVLRSTNEGATWTATTPPSANEAHEQLWLDAQNGYVVGNLFARRTTNGGATWSALPGVPDSDFFNEVITDGPGRVIAIADFHEAKTTNGGATWSWEFVVQEPLYGAKTVVFGPGHRMTATDLEGAVVFETTNDGADWTELYSRFDTSGFLEFVRLDDGSLHLVSTEGDHVRSTDGGATWINATVAPGDDVRVTISEIVVLPNDRAYAGSTPPGQAIFRWHRSDDGGLTWYEPPTNPGVISTDAMEFWDSDRGVVTGSLLLNKASITSDGGVTWTQVNLPNSIVAGVRGFDLAMPAAGIAYCAADGQSGATLFRTSDFGATWEQRNSGIPTSTGWLGSVSFLDANIGFAAGGSTNLPQIWKTTNAGASWSTVGTSGLPSFLNDIHWFDAQNALACCANTGSGIFRTTNGGTNWTQVAAGATRQIEFADALVGYASPGSFQGGSILVTEDAGATWETLELPSTGAGQTIRPTPYGCLIGGYGSSIVRAERLGAVDAPTSDDGADALVPWIRATGSVGAAPLVSWSITLDGVASVDILDAQGRRVRTLEQRAMRAGETAQAEWDGRDSRGRLAPTGVYFARLTVDETRHGNRNETRETKCAARAVKLVLAR